MNRQGVIAAAMTLAVLVALSTGTASVMAADPLALASVTISGRTATGATATVAIDNSADNGPGTVYLRYRTTPDGAYSGDSTASEDGAAAVFTLTGLETGVEYEVQASLTADYAASVTATFTTVTPPVLTGLTIVSDTTGTSATATTSLTNPQSASQDVSMRYRTRPAGSWSTIQTETTTGTSQAFSLTGLDAGVEYQVQVSLLTTFANPQTETFTTPDPCFNDNLEGNGSTSATFVSGCLSDNTSNSTATYWAFYGSGPLKITQAQVNGVKYSSTCNINSGKYFGVTIYVMRGIGRDGPILGEAGGGGGTNTTSKTYASMDLAGIPLTYGPYTIELNTATSSVNYTPWSCSPGGSPATTGSFSLANVDYLMPEVVPGSGSPLYTNAELLGWNAVVTGTGADTMIEMSWIPDDDADGYEIESRDNGILTRRTGVTQDDFANMGTAAAISRVPGSQVGITPKTLTYVIVRVRAYQQQAPGVIWYSPWTEERIMTFVRYDYEARDDITGEAPDTLGLGAFLAKLFNSGAGFDADGKAYLLPLVFTGALVAGGGVAWLLSAGAWGASGIIAGSIVFILIWSVAGPIWLGVNAGMAIAPPVIMAVLGLLALKQQGG